MHHQPVYYNMDNTLLENRAKLLENMIGITKQDNCFKTRHNKGVLFLNKKQTKKFRKYKENLDLLFMILHDQY